MHKILPKSTDTPSNWNPQGYVPDAVTRLFSVLIIILFITVIIVSRFLLMMDMVTLNLLMKILFNFCF